MNKLGGLLGLCAGLLWSTVSLSATLKIAALVPQGTSWADSLESMAKDIKKATDGRVKFKLYLGGVAGDEPDVMRKIRVGQLHGGVFTGKTLGDVYGDFRILEVPFNFNDDRQKGLKILGDLAPHLNEGFRAQGFENLGYYEVGQVYFVSKKKASSIQDLKGMKIWAWEGDELVKAMMETLNLVSVPLALPDVLNSLSTGMIEAAYASPLGIIALQWQSKVEYLIDFPISYGFGSFMVGSKAWKKISEKDQATVRQIVDDYVKKTNEQTLVENKQSLEALKKSGIKFIEFPKQDIEKSHEIRQQVLQRLKGKLLSEKIITLYNKASNS